MCVFFDLEYSQDEYKSETLYYDVALSRLISFIFQTYQKSPINM